MELSLPVQKLKAKAKFALDEVIKKWKFNNNFIGVIGYGSYFNDSFNINSDIDIWGVLSCDHHERRYISYNNFSFDINISSLSYLKAYALRNNHWIPTVANSTIILDSENKIKSIINIIKETESLGPSLPRSPKYLIQHKFLALNVISEFKKNNTWNIDKEILATNLIEQLYPLMCLQRKIWPSYSKGKLFGHARENLPDIAILIQHFFNVSDKEKKLQIIFDYIDKVFNKLGGINLPTQTTIFYKNI